jgi:hypothetical protein
MTREIQIGGAPVKFTGNAATTYRYRQLFNRDLIRAFMQQGTDLDTDMIMELSFVMHLQAEGADNARFNSVSAEDYIAWLEGFEFLDVLGAAPEILGLWADSSKPVVRSKKK